MDELFVRYWDNALSAAEAEELDARLAADPAARESFRLLCLQAVAAADLPASAIPSGPPPQRPRVTRRRALRYLAAGGAAAAAGLLGWWGRRDEPAPAMRLSSTRGAVTLRTSAGKQAPLTGPVPPGATLSTIGPSSSAVLSYHDGTNISFTGDSVVVVVDRGERLLLCQGTASAEVCARPEGAPALTLATPEALLRDVSEAVLTLGHGAKGTEVGVHQGLVNVSAPTGERMDVVRGGEMLTVRRRQKQRLKATPDAMVWDFERPLPADWHVGSREVTPDGPAVVPELWYDPYHHAEMYQVRSDKQWSRGFCRLFPESVVRVKYWLERPGPSQVCFIVRSERHIDPLTGVVECNEAFDRGRPRQWQWLEVKAADMLDNRHGPTFPAPWVAFLVIFNTYKVDLGLKVAELRVTRGPRPAEA